MFKNWREISDDEMLNFDGTQPGELARYERIMQKRATDAQSRQQRAIKMLTTVIAIATVAYTLITGISAYATFQANDIQQQALNFQKQHSPPPQAGTP